MEGLRNSRTLAARQSDERYSRLVARNSIAAAA